MNRKRANEIISSPETIDVTYNDESVYIENVNPNKDMASVHTLNRPELSQEVQLTQLVEQ